MTFTITEVQMLWTLGILFALLLIGFLIVCVMLSESNTKRDRLRIELRTTQGRLELFESSIEGVRAERDALQKSASKSYVTHANLCDENNSLKDRLELIRELSDPSKNINDILTEVSRNNQ